MGNAPALDDGQAHLLDLMNSVDVALIDRSQWLMKLRRRCAGSGANAALIGDELIQFGEATPRRWSFPANPPASRPAGDRVGDGLTLGGRALRADRAQYVAGCPSASINEGRERSA